MCRDNGDPIQGKVSTRTVKRGKTPVRLESKAAIHRSDPVKAWPHHNSRVKVGT
jgi:hypothetical protein